MTSADVTVLSETACVPAFQRAEASGCARACPAAAEPCSCATVCTMQEGQQHSRAVQLCQMRTHVRQTAPRER